jgi:LysM repeat protein
LVPIAKKEEKKNAGGTTHTVESSETLYSIARKYNVTTDQIKQWNNLSDNTISVGQQLSIKSIGTAVQNQPEAALDYSGKKTHTVVASETLYSISKEYNVTIDDLKKWNKMDGNEISIGQVLIVSSASNTTVSNSSMLPSNVEQTKTPVETSTETTINVSDIKTPEVAVGPTTNQTIDSKKILETGFAQVIEGSSETKKYLALHRTAPIGTIMQVKNTMNNQTVFVRVVGALPNTGENDKILLKISKKAFDRLGAVDAKFPVEISFVP